MRSFVRRLVFLCAVLALPATVFAQDAVLTGTITDSTGAVLPGVTVTAVNEATGNNYETVSDAAGVYHARAERVPFPTEGTRRERVTAYLAAEARAFERFVAAAPEQWLAVFHPIWPDLEGQSGPNRAAEARA